MSELLGNDELPYAEIKIDDHLSLRQIQLDEAGKIFSLVDEDREYLDKWLPWVEGTQSPADSREFIAETIQQRTDGSSYGYGIVIDGEPVGHASLMHIKDGQEPEIGYWVASKVSGHGIGTKTAGALTDFGFNKLGLAKIIIKAAVSNTGSNNIAKRLGYKVERQEDDPRVGLSNVWALERS